MDSEAPPDRPIFIVAPHRSGTTVLYRILGRHADTAYFTLASRRFPQMPRMVALAGRLGSSRLPRESQWMWDRFKSSDVDTRTAADVGPELTEWYRRAVNGTVRSTGATRFVAKYPRLSLAIPWLEVLFPGALYVHLDRDWRAVVCSTTERHLKRVGREKTWFGVYFQGWQDWVGRPADEISTMQYVAATRAIEDQAQGLGDRYVRLTYRDLCAAPHDTLRALLERIDLRWDGRFERVVETFGLESRNAKWRKQLGEERIEELREIDRELLLRHESDTAPAA